MQYLFSYNLTIDIRNNSANMWTCQTNYNHVVRLASLDRPVTLSEPSHSDVIWLVHVRDLLVDGFTVDHLDGSLAEETLLELNELLEEAGVWSDLGSA